MRIARIGAASAPPYCLAEEGSAFEAHVGVKKPFVGAVVRRVTVAVRSVVGGAMRGEFLAPRRLRRKMLSVDCREC
jgi:hypothetical protein